MLSVSPALLAADAKKESEQEEDIAPTEDLMREHGVLDRLLLIYEAGLRKFASNKDFDPAIITAGTSR